MSIEDEAREALIEQAVWALIDYDTDVVDRGVRDEHYQERRKDVERIFPIIAAGFTRHPQPPNPLPNSGGQQITDEQVKNARKAIHRSIILNHFSALASAEEWDQADYEAMLNEFATVALEAALGEKNEGNDHA